RSRIMRKLRALAVLTALSCAVIANGRSVASVGFASTDDEDDENAESIQAEVVATGIPGAGAVAKVGTFHTGGPFHDRPEFAAFTEPGQVLHRTRLFVTSTSNFGAPLARPSEAPGSVLSLDVSDGPIAVPSDFASGGGQASAARGKAILYTAQSPDFLNSITNPGAATADRPAVSLPLGISFNNGFGRPWFANAPAGSTGDGTITVI